MRSLFISPWNDPALNLAAEEHFLWSQREEMILLYVNASSVIVGRYQNVFGEVNLPLAYAMKIPVLRRLSGGGTVYHDPGNLNFSFILNSKEGKRVEPGRYLGTVADFLRHHGVPACFDRRHNILVDGKKVSGHAEHLSRGRAILHGTLLFDADLSRLEEILHPVVLVADKAIRSVRSEVTNLHSRLGEGWEMGRLIREMTGHFQKVFSPCIPYSLTRDDETAIERLAQEKYRTWEWNIAASPPSLLRRRITARGEEADLLVTLRKGCIEKVEAAGSGAIRREAERLDPALAGVPFRPGDLGGKLLRLHGEGKLSVFSPEEWLSYLFG